MTLQEHSSTVTAGAADSLACRNSFICKAETTERPKAYLQQNLNFTDLPKEQDETKTYDQTPHRETDVAKHWHIREIQFKGKKKSKRLSYQQTSFHS